MTAVVFCGPTISAGEARRHVDAECRPPAALGDLFRAIRSGHRMIGLVDGYFERVPATWHKEILWALSEGAHVWGAASMGALRAAELAPFGMVGIGGIYEEYARGMLEDDDEVAVAHAPGGDFRATSVAMVDIRASLARAEADGVISGGPRAVFEERAKRLFYAERMWSAVLDHDRCPRREREALARWLPRGAVHRKRADAVALLRAMRRFLATDPPPFRPSFSFEPTSFWEEAVGEMDGEVDARGTFVPAARILDELTLEPDRYLRLRYRAMSRSASPAPGPWLRRAILEQSRGDRELVDRAASKADALAAVGWDEVRWEDLDLDRDTLVRWWFGDVQGRAVPADLGWYAARADVSETTLLRVLRREYAFRRLRSGLSGSRLMPECVE